MRYRSKINPGRIIDVRGPVGNMTQVMIGGEDFLEAYEPMPQCRSATQIEDELEGVARRHGRASSDLCNRAAAEIHRLRVAEESWRKAACKVVEETF